MTYALGSVLLGVAAYLVILFTQSKKVRTDRDSWEEWRFIGALFSALLGAVTFWFAMAAGPEAGWSKIIESLFTKGKRIWVPIMGFAGLSFTILATAHVTVLRVLERRGHPNDA